MNLPLLDTIVWMLFLAVLACAIVLAVLASRPRLHWAMTPVVVLVAAVIVLALLGAWATAPHPVLALPAAALLLLLGVIGGSPLVLLVLQLAGSDKVALGAHGGILVEASDTAKPEREILRGGATIGYLERLAIAGAILAGQPAAVAIVVAVKGLGRFSELETSAARERFIIGTLVSIIWAAACAAPVVIGYAVSS